MSSQVVDTARTFVAERRPYIWPACLVSFDPESSLGQGTIPVYLVDDEDTFSGAISTWGHAGPRLTAGTLLVPSAVEEERRLEYALCEAAVPHVWYGHVIGEVDTQPGAWLFRRWSQAVVVSGDALSHALQGTWPTRESRSEACDADTASTSEAATSLVDTRIEEHIEPLIAQLFAAGAEEFFEDGMETGFSRGLLDLVPRYGGSALRVIERAVLDPSANVEVAGEALRWIGQVDDVNTKDGRRMLLERALLPRSSKVRDGALLGISLMDDPASISAVRGAVARESVPSLRDDMLAVLRQLEDTEKCRSS